MTDRKQLEVFLEDPEGHKEEIIVSLDAFNTALREITLKRQGVDLGEMQRKLDEAFASADGDAK